MTERPGAYVRGAAGVPVGRRRVLTVLTGSAVALVVAVLLAMTVHALGEAQRIARVQDHGVPVPVTVTGCVGLASGTGITTSGYRCTGAFRLHGQRHDAVIRGSAALLPPGNAVQGIALPADPEVLYAADATTGSPWAPVVPPATLLAATVLGTVLATGRAPRTRRTSPRAARSAG